MKKIVEGLKKLKATQFFHSPSGDQYVPKYAWAEIHGDGSGSVIVSNGPGRMQVVSHFEKGSTEADYLTQINECLPVDQRIPPTDSTIFAVAVEHSELRSGDNFGNRKFGVTYSAQVRDGDSPDEVRAALKAKAVMDVAAMFDDPCPAEKPLAMEEANALAGAVKRLMRAIPHGARSVLSREAEDAFRDMVAAHGTYQQAIGEMPF